MAESKSAVDDWTRSGPVKLAPGVHRIPLSLPIDGLSTVNSYLFTGGSDVVLVDPGWARDETDVELNAALADLDLNIEDVTSIVITHHHWDHLTQAIQLRKRHGIPISIGREEKNSLGHYAADDKFFPAQVGMLRTAGAADLARQIDEYVPEEYERGKEYGLADRWLVTDDVVSVGDRALQVIATPGHTRGSVVFLDRANNLMVTGDHILPRITPSFGLEYNPERFPLRSFMNSLRLMRQYPDAQVLPAHGAVTDSVHRRADELLAHHEARLNAVVSVLADGAETPFEVARGLRWTRHDRALEDLAPVHQMTAVLEIASHLDLLVDEDRVRRHAVDGLDRYSIN